MSIWSILRQIFGSPPGNEGRNPDPAPEAGGPPVTPEPERDMGDLTIKNNSAGKASYPDSARVRARAERSDMLAQDELEARQGEAGGKRRQAGPEEDVSYPDEPEPQVAREAPESEVAQPPRDKA
ncbi:MAG: hypothetical protein QF898_11860 [SAR202 cluster bacterium]|nr:hypothetical protein [SAR202 cluster bacterium]MDP6513589.1 hypothetical protein [SAR202 cluster bacterium]MDP6713838.1 hypothetical protein [SAR202 cluster bacterium]